MEMDPPTTRIYPALCTLQKTFCDLGGEATFYKPRPSLPYRAGKICSLKSSLFYIKFTLISCVIYAICYPTAPMISPMV